MSPSAEWRSFGEFDVVLLVDDAGAVRQAMTAGPAVLHDFLTEMRRIPTMHGDHEVAGERRNPEPWGALVMSRAENGQIIDMDPERFWNGVYIWFRSRGVDYDTPLTYLKDGGYP